MVPSLKSLIEAASTMYDGVRIEVAWTNKCWNSDQRTVMQVMNIFISTQKVTMMMVKMTLSMMMSGSHRWEATSGLSTTYPLLSEKFKLRSKLVIERRERTCLKLPASRSPGHPERELFSSIRLCKQEENLRRGPSKGKTRSSPGQSSSHFHWHTGCSWGWRPCAQPHKNVSWSFSAI